MRSLEALWVVIPSVGQTAGFRGVVVLDTGRILGGDHGSTWVGKWRFENGKIQVRLTVDFYNPDSVSLFDRNVRKYELEGSLTPAQDSETITGQVRVVGHPEQIAELKMRRVAELPNPS